MKKVLVFGGSGLVGSRFVKLNANQFDISAPQSQEIDILNKEYDPYVAEVIDLIEGNKDNIVIEVLRKGYKYNGQVIRVAQVKVSKKRIQNSESRI